MAAIMLAGSLLPGEGTETILVEQTDRDALRSRRVVGDGERHTGPEAELCEGNVAEGVAVVVRERKLQILRPELQEEAAVLRHDGERAVVVVGVGTDVRRVRLRGRGVRRRLRVVGSGGVH